MFSPTITLPKTDARWFQIAFLGQFLIYGIIFLGWETEVWRYLGFAIGCLAAQFLGIYFRVASPDSWKSALITTLGLSLLLHTSFPVVAALVGFVSVGAKFVFRWQGKHFINPGNFGICAAILAGAPVWISAGQWGSAVILLFLVGSLGTLVLLKVGRIETGLAFLGSFILLQWVYQCLWLGWPLDLWMHKISNGSLLLFSFFMITDPVSTPNHQKVRILWAVGIAVVAFVAAEFFYLKSTPIWTLFFMSFLTPLLDILFKSNTFNWKKI